MKALTLTQPWASLMALGVKKAETRSWSTRYRGPLAIHAAKTFPGWAKELFWDELIEYFPGFEQGCYPIPERLPRGEIVAICELCAVVSTDNDEFMARLPELEMPLGDYSAGRFAWVVKNVRALPKPMPCRGHLGLWDVPTEIATQLEIGASV